MYQYLTFVRMEKATQLLLTGTPPSEVCYAVDFESLSSFGCLFTRIVGVTPSTFFGRTAANENANFKDPAEVCLFIYYIICCLPAKVL